MISAAEYQRRLMTVANSSVLEAMMDEIIASDTNVLVDEKIKEFTYGLMPDGSKIGVYQNAEYAFFKSTINPLAGGYVDLMVKREFVGGLHLDKLYRKAYIFNSTDWKRDLLASKYSMDIFGINQEFWLKRQTNIYRLVLVQMIKNKANIG